MKESILQIFLVNVLWSEVHEKKMATISGKNKLKMGSGGRYYGAYLIYDVANSYLSALHAKIPATDATRTNPSSPVHVQNPRKFILSLSLSRFFYRLLSFLLFPLLNLTLVSNFAWFIYPLPADFLSKNIEDFHLMPSLSFYFSKSFSK